MTATALYKDTHFFGRTYASNPISLIENEGGYETTTGDYFYLSTYLPAETLKLIVELVVYEIGENKLPMKSTVCSIGWVSLSVPKEKRAQTVPLYKGSPRLIYLGEVNTEQGWGRFEYVCSQITMLKEIHSVIPIDCVCGPSDSFPGIFDYHLPRVALSFLEYGISNRSEMQILPSGSVFLNKCVLRIPNDLEQELLNEYKKVTGTKITITERRLNVGAHNQWHFVNETKDKNSISLLPDPPFLQCSGILIINNVYLCDNLALIFELEYGIKLDNTIRYITLGEFVQPLTYSRIHNNIGNIEIDEDMNTDMEIQVLNRPIWCPLDDVQGARWKIRLHCEISPSQGTAADDNTRKRMAMLNEQKRQEKLRLQREEELKKSKKKKEDKLKKVQAELVAKDKELEKLRTEKKLTETVIKKPIETTAPQPSKLQGAIFDAIVSEKSDTFKASTINISFLSFIPTIHEVELNRVPKRICFSFKFFNSPQLNTSAANLISGSWLLEPGKNVGTWSNVSSKEEKVMKVQWDFDPSFDLEVPYDMQIEEFAKYLLSHKLRIVLWNADNLLYLGSTVISLSELARRGKSIVTVDKDLTVTNEDNEVIGKLQMQFISIGKMAGEVEERMYKTIKDSSKGKMKLKSKAITKSDVKHLSSVPEMSLSQEDFRKSKMVLDYKLQEKQSTSYLNEEIQKYRSLSRTFALSNIVNKSMQKISNALFYYLGQVMLYPIEFINPDNKDTKYYIEIADPESQVEVIHIVTDPDEWRFLCSKEKIMPPSNCHLFNANSHFTAKGKEKIVLLFKVFSIVRPVKVVRTFRILIKRLNDDFVAFRKDTILKFKEIYYNSTSIIHSPERKGVDVPIQEAFPVNLIPLVQKILCSNQNTTVSWSNNRLTASFVTPLSPNDAELLFFFFSDIYCYDTLYISQVIVRSYKCLDLVQAAGYFSSTVLEFSSKNPRQGEMHTSDKSIVAISPKVSGVILIKPKEEIKIPVKIGSLRVGKFTTFVHCIGILSFNVNRL